MIKARLIEIEFAEIDEAIEMNLKKEYEKCSKILECNEDVNVM